ncbi:MAG: PadR family transcriptional regulator [Candidatus Aegiribacteria sp.]|nr:PadR family transcriptional regulator [Candidatus Aegiribacteria sp.]MBD3294852.1 PadR family transcriptional regulator [Candidatus Fermentibacteria bacterium]
MPRRRRRGGLGRCRRRINRFLEPCLLLLLHGGDSYGYELLENLQRFGFSENPADSSTIYRIMRSLEEKGFVSSRWAEGDSGPARRIYCLTRSGDSYLQIWVEDLRETDRILHRFFEEYRDHMERFHSEDEE